MTRPLIFSAILLLVPLALGAAPVPKHLMRERPLAESLKGKWQLTSRVEDGVASDPDLIKKRTMVVGDGTYTLYNVTDELLVAKFAVDAAKAPPHFDIPEPDLSQFGVLKLEGDVLTICIGPPGGSRATGFESPKGKGQILVTYTRVR